MLCTFENLALYSHPTEAPGVPRGLPSQHYPDPAPLSFRGLTGCGFSLQVLDPGALTLCSNSSVCGSQQTKHLPRRDGLVTAAWSEM
uniref:Uncharacterized protein n=1 Tax=Knipowitschia caucasica TaxID=637954 RepID=A0AAV2L8C3_KNICA